MCLRFASTKFHKQLRRQPSRAVDWARLSVSGRHCWLRPAGCGLLVGKQPPYSDGVRQGLAARLDALLDALSGGIIAMPRFVSQDHKVV